MNPFYKNLALWMVIGLIVILLFNYFLANQPDRAEIAFSDFLNKVEAGEVREVTIRGESIMAILKDGSRLRTYGIVDSNLVTSLREHGVKIWVRSPADSNPWYMIVANWLPMLVFIGVWIFFMRKWRGPGGTGPRQG